MPRLSQWNPTQSHVIVAGWFKSLRVSINVTDEVNTTRDSGVGESGFNGNLVQQKAPALQLQDHPMFYSQSAFKNESLAWIATFWLFCMHFFPNSPSALFTPRVFW